MSSSAQAPRVDAILDGLLRDMPEPLLRATEAVEQAQRRMLEPRAAAPFRAMAAPSWQEEGGVRVLALGDITFISDSADEPGPSGGPGLFGCVLLLIGIPMTAWLPFSGAPSHLIAVGPAIAVPGALLLLLHRARSKKAGAWIRRTGLYLLPDMLIKRAGSVFHAYPRARILGFQRVKKDGMTGFRTFIKYRANDGQDASAPIANADVYNVVERWRSERPQGASA